MDSFQFFNYLCGINYNYTDILKLWQMGGRWQQISKSGLFTLYVMRSMKLSMVFVESFSAFFLSLSTNVSFMILVYC